VFGHYGGLFLYFYFLKAMIITMSLMSLATIPALISNIEGTSINEEKKKNN
jgi:hypothetical protein